MFIRALNTKQAFQKINPTASILTKQRQVGLKAPSFITMSLRNKSAAATGGQPQKPLISRDVFELSAQLERQADIIENIKVAKKEIAEKQRLGRQLALNVADSQAQIDEHMRTKEINTTQEGRFEREQRYQMFIEKMQQLYKSEKRLGKQRKEALAKMETNPVQSLTPIKSCLKDYSKIADKGWDCGVLAESLKYLNSAVAAVGNNPLHFNDYSLTEMDQSWRMDKLTEDIRFGLIPNPNVFFSPYNLAKVSRELGELGYKNTDLMPLWFDKLEQMLTSNSTEDFIEGAKVDFSQAMFGGQKNFYPRHYIYQGFDGNKEFEQHVQTLLEYQENKKQSLNQKLKTEGGSKEFNEIKRSAINLINSANQVKDMQKDMESAVRNVRAQYSKLKKAHDEHEFLQENPYVNLDLMELQEMLIKAGYLSPDEQKVGEDVSIGNLGMDAAVEVFYNMVLNQYPDALSPQYDQFYDASVEASKGALLIAANKGDKYAHMRVHTLSSTLVGLEKQALSYRRDIIDNDYPTEFYQKLMLPEEEWLQANDHLMSQYSQKIGHQILSTHVKMERTHLNAWDTFVKGTENIPQIMDKMLNGPASLDDLYSAMRGLNVCKFEARKVRDKISDKFVKASESKRKCDPQALIDGVMGLAGCTYKPRNAQKMIARIVNELQSKMPKKNIGKTMGPQMRTIESFNFRQVIELLKGLSTPGVASGKGPHIQCVRELVARVDSLNFDVITNELKFDEFEQLYDAYSNLKFSEVKEMRDIFASSFKNQSLKGAFENYESTKIFYEEGHAAKYDPVKPRVIGGLTESLIKADLNDLNVMQMNETQGMNKGMFPYSPDVLMGYEGQKVGIFVLNSDRVMRDTQVPCGFTQAKMRLSEQAHILANKTGTSALKSIALPVQSVVDADLKQHKMSLRKDFNISKFLKKSGLARHIEDQRIDTSLLTDFSVELARRAEKVNMSSSAVFEQFSSQLLNLLLKREKMDAIFEQQQVLAAIDELKLETLKLLMIFETTLSEHEKFFITESLPQQAASSFEKFLTSDIIEPLIQTQRKIGESIIESKSDQGNVRFWQGTRQEVEVPQSKQNQIKLKGNVKDIAPELLNHRFFRYESYHHYADWENKMRETYDQFNLLEIPENGKDSPTFYFNDKTFNRRVPRGIFPDAKSPRIVLRPPGSELAVADKSLADPMTKFERSPMKEMVKKELLQNAELANLMPNSEMRTICNLQNIKHSLKSDVSDQQICDLLFNKLQFTDKLIEEHLSNQTTEGGAAVFVDRDPESYREFLNKQMSSAGEVVSPYDHFFMKEALKKGNPEEIAAKIIQLEQEHQFEMKTEVRQAKIDELKRQLEDILVNYKRANEDHFNLSKALDNSVEVTIDISEFSPVQKRNNVGLCAVDLEMAPDMFLEKQRCRAEANLIKARIAYKVHQNNLRLSVAEQKYLDIWIKKASKTKALLSQADLMVPSRPSGLALSQALSADDFYSLNSLSRVSIHGDQKHDIALNDLVLELNNFIDPSSVHKVEMALLEDSLKNKWQLGADFNLVEHRNREIDLVMSQMEEKSWRAAAVFDQRDKQYIEEMVFFDRGLDAFDNAFLEMDRASFSEFFDEANSFDQRTTLLENWLCRKDEEVRNRVTLPTSQLAKSDRALFNKYDAPLKQARESLVGELLVTDEFGKDRIQKAYGELTTRELHLIVESLCVRLGLFQNKYPSFLPQAVKAILEHENLANSDRFMIDTYCKLFELDWRGDTSLENRESFMLSNPVYMNENDRTSTATFGIISNESVLSQIRQACRPFLPNLIQKMRQLSQSSPKQ